MFAVLTILGVVTDPTTDGITDSTQALGYTEPKKDEIWARIDFKLLGVKF